MASPFNLANNSTSVNNTESYLESGILKQPQNLKMSCIIDVFGKISTLPSQLVNRAKKLYRTVKSRFIDSTDQDSLVLTAPIPMATISPATFKTSEDADTSSTDSSCSTYSRTSFNLAHFPMVASRLAVLNLEREPEVNAMIQQRLVAKKCRCKITQPRELLRLAIWQGRLQSFDFYHPQFIRDIGTTQRHVKERFEQHIRHLGRPTLREFYDGSAPIGHSKLRECHYPQEPLDSTKKHRNHLLFSEYGPEFDHFAQYPRAYITMDAILRIIKRWEVAQDN